ncbi:glycosyltransferase family 2 protein [Lederbergia panacisoli]|uniref:glycosyltransferase family 2 protein n=1 Tax=Lederbergia panacisoli TaxID=1255251 RepID=UPI00214B270E|nr:glycosyltransferase [Lederbergia panacisoli]MCR2823822.1 glycosyltransferase [Lederbergia panacisoli]
MDDKISVIVPVYNVEEYLPKCIESIINQTYTNLEIILVNDGSTDKCGEICNHYELVDKRIQVIHKKNGGLSDARNEGLNAATGKYINFIDSDDYIHKEYYEALINLMVENNADITQCQFIKVYERNETKYNNDTNNDDINKDAIVLNNIEALNNLYNNNYVPTVVAWNKLYKKELFADIRFPKGKIHEDEFTMYKLLFSSKKVAITPKGLYYYLQRGNSIMGENFNPKRLNILEAYSNQIEFYSKKKLFDLKLKAVLKQESNLRNLMRKTLNSNLDNKRELFDYLINYYKRDFYYSIKGCRLKGKRRILLYLFKYNPKAVISFICKLLDNRDNGKASLKRP